MSITIELLEKEIRRLRIENEKLSKECAAAKTAAKIKTNDANSESNELSLGLLHAYKKLGSYPCIYITCDLPADDEMPIALIEYNKDSGKLQISAYDDTDSDPKAVFETKINLQEMAQDAAMIIKDDEAVLSEAYRQEHPDEVITIREEAELRGEIENAKQFCRKFAELAARIIKIQEE